MNDKQNIADLIGALVEDIEEITESQTNCKHNNTTSQP